MRSFRSVRKTAESDNKLRQVCLSISVRPPALNNSVPTGRIFMKFDIWVFFEKLSRKFQVPLKSNKNNGYFTCRPIHIFDHVLLRSS